MFRRSARLWSLLAFPALFAVAACTEDLETGAVCPTLCPGQGVDVFDTILTPAYVYDSTLVGYPTQGLENPLFLAARGDSLDVRTVIRFDTLQRFFRPTPADTLRPITDVDSAYLSVIMRADGLPTPGTFFVDVYDVDDAAISDTILSEIVPLFTPARLMGTYEGDSTLTDSVRVRIPLDSAYLRAIIQDPDRRLRLGLQVRSADAVQLRITPFTLGVDAGPFVEYRVSPDEIVGRVGPLQPYSETPTTPLIVADDLTDYIVVVNAPGTVASGRFSVGGFPGTRAYLRFDLPRWLTDSVGVLKAELEMVQDPVRGMSDADTVTLNTHLVLAGYPITEERRAATLLSPPDIFTLPLRVVPSDSGQKRLSMGGLVRQWRTFDGVQFIPTAIVFRSAVEGTSPATVRFFGFDAADPALRPRLRVSYTPNVIFGRP